MVNFDPKLFLKLAKEMAGRSEEECHRTAIGRAYYSVFLQWRSSVAGELGVHPHDLRHKDFRSHLRRKSNFAAGLVQSLWERRECADYRMTNPAQSRQRSMSLPMNASTAKNAIAEAEQAHIALRRLYP